jgi:hypothetical protein
MNVCMGNVITALPDLMDHRQPAAPIDLALGLEAQPGAQPNGLARKTTRRLSPG